MYFRPQVKKCFFVPEEEKIDSKIDVKRIFIDLHFPSKNFIFKKKYQILDFFLSVEQHRLFQPS